MKLLGAKTQNQVWGFSVAVSNRFFGGTCKLYFILISIGDLLLKKNMSLHMKPVYPLKKIKEKLKLQLFFLLLQLLELKKTFLNLN